MTRDKEPGKPAPGGGPDFHPDLRELKKHGDKDERPSTSREMTLPYLGPDGDTSPDDMDAYLDEGNIADASAISKGTKARK